MIEDIIIGFFAALGMAVVAVVIWLFLKDILETTINKIQIRSHKAKHRFDKEPKAECYCIDCTYWYRDEEARQSGYCTYNGQHVLECFFCKCASIRKEKRNE